MFAQVCRCVINYRAHGEQRLQYNWTLGEAPEYTISNLCRKCFAKCYGTTHNLVDACCNDLKLSREQQTGLRTSADPVFNDRTAVNRDKNAYLKDIEGLAASNDYDLSAEEKSLLVLPNTIEGVTCFRWMTTYFLSFGAGW